MCKKKSLNLKVFDDINRNYMEPKKAAGSIFEYLNRSGREDISKIRLTIENWYEKYPDKYKNMLRKRLRSSDNTESMSAWFELYLYNELIKKFDVEIEPEIQETGKRPDYLIKKGDQKLFYLEACVLNDKEDPNVARVIDYIDTNADVKNYLIMRLIQIGKTTPKLKMILNRVGDLKPGGGYVYKENGWIIEFEMTKMPISNPANRKIGMSFTIFWGSDKKLKNKINKKIEQRVESNIPYIIAVNICSIAIDIQDVLDVLYGGEFVQQDGKILRRKKYGSGNFITNGIFLGPEGFRNKRISGVLIFTNLFPWNSEDIKANLWLNPGAEIKIQPELLNWLIDSYYILDGDEIKRIDL